MQTEVKEKKSKNFKYSATVRKKKILHDALHSPREWDKIDANP